MKKRVVSLIASSTEIVCALGFESHLVGRSHECGFPTSVQRLPVCTEPRFRVDGTSREIDQRVKAVLQEGLSVYRVHADVLERLRPDVIITQLQCEVCAVSPREVGEAVGQITGWQPAIVSLEAKCLADVWVDIRRVAQALDARKRGEELVVRLRERMDRVARRVGWLPHRPTVACIEWVEPLMAAGNWMPELVEMAGGVNLFGEAGKHSPWMTWEELREADPDVVAVLPCGFGLERTRKEVGALVQKPGWGELKAVRDARVYLMDGSQYFNRPGPRLADSLEILAEVLHPEMFRFGYRGKGWEPL
ncbi:MAG: cobalamin-binding protein [Nitrospinota bacterium]